MEFEDKTQESKSHNDFPSLQPETLEKIRETLLYTEKCRIPPKIIVISNIHVPDSNDND